MSIITGLIAVAPSSAGLLSLIPFVGPILAGMDIAAATAVIALWVPLLNHWATIGDYLAALENVMSEFWVVQFSILYYERDHAGVSSCGTDAQTLKSKLTER